MLEELKNKEVNFLISSNSGISATGGDSIEKISSSIIMINGTVEKIDADFIKVINGTIIYNLAHQERFLVGPGQLLGHNPNDMMAPHKERFTELYIRKDKVITISVI